MTIFEIFWVLARRKAAGNLPIDKVLQRRQRSKEPKSALLHPIGTGSHFKWLIILARYPAPNPLSIFTTLTPLAQEFSIESNADSP